MNIRIFAVAVAVLTASCTGAQPAAAPPPTTSSTAPPSPADLDLRAKKALAPAGAFDALGGRVERNYPGDDSEPGYEQEIVRTACGSHDLRVDSGTSVSRSRAWAGGVDLFERVHAMSDLPAAVLLTTVQRWSRLCTSYSPGGVSPLRTVVPDVSLVRPEGVDESYAYCEANNDPALVPWSCHAVLARGTLLATVTASGRSQDAALAQLTSVVPIFAESLAKG
ncbi:hypothetical protein ACIA8G_11130 [Lentzea sp. NPDC051213]|uniref:hypothetical protein n=1 Tax=Lentzea sp. NPDC051213 TaxID=3364126 RepID=UPI00379E13B7